MGDTEFYYLDLPMPVSNEHPLDRALRTNDVALRCYYWENKDDGWDALSPEDRDTFDRPPRVPRADIPSGTFFIAGRIVTYDQAREHGMYSFQAE